MIDRDQEGLDELDVYMNNLINTLLNLDQKRLLKYMREQKDNDPNFSLD